MIYPLVNVYIAIDNGPVEILFIFPFISHGGSFHFVMLARLPGRVKPPEIVDLPGFTWIYL